MKRALLVLAVAAAGCQAFFEPQLKQGRAYPCRLDAGDGPPDGGKLADGSNPQCSGGWRCGLERGREVPVCHAPGDERAYVCTSTANCEGQWTCGIEGFCIPPVDDAFRPGANEDAGRIVERASQAVLLRRPEHVVAVEERTFLAGFHGSSVGFIEGGRLTLVVRTRFGPPDVPAVGAFSHEVLGAPAPANVNDIGGSLGVAAQVFALTDDGAGYFHLDFDGVRFLPDTPYQPVWPKVRQEHLRMIPHAAPYVVAFGDGGTITQLLFPFDPRGFVRDAGDPSSTFGHFDYPPVAFFLDGGYHLFNRVDDVSAVAMPDDHYTVLIASVDGLLFNAERYLTPAPFPRGLFQTFVPLGDGGFVHQPNFIGDAGFTFPFFYPMEFLPPQGGRAVPLEANGYQFDDAGYRAGRIRVRGQRVAIEMFKSGGSPSYVMLGQEFFEPPPGGAEPLPFATVLLAPCQACPPGLQLTDFRPFIPSGALTSAQPVVEVRCSVPGGVELTYVVQPAVGSAGCSAQQVDVEEGGPGPLFDAVLEDESVVGAGGWIGDHGQLWLGDSLSSPLAYFLDGIPAAVVRGGTDVAAFRNQTVYFNRAGSPFGFISESGLPQDGIKVVASVAGRDDWVVIDSLVVARQTLGGFGASGGEAVAIPGRSIDERLLGPPYFGTVAFTNDGGVMVLLSSNDALFSADVTEIYRDAGARFGQVELRHIPVNRVAIRSLAALDVPTDGGPYARGFVLARSNLIEFVADDVEHWRSRPLPVPPGEMLEVWADHDRGRVGFVDGRVFSLPGLKQLAPPLGSPVHDYLQFQGQPWAVAENGVWRLRSGADAGLGEWYQDVQPPADGGHLEYRGARLFETNGAVFLFTVHGLAVRFR